MPSYFILFYLHRSFGICDLENQLIERFLDLCGHLQYILDKMGAIQCCQVPAESSFQSYCRSYASPEFSTYLDSIKHDATNIYETRQNGQYILGNWKQGHKKTGKGIIFSPHQFYYEGEIVEQKANGKGKIVLPNKIIYQGYTQNNTAKGQGQLYFQQQQTKLKGKWQNGLPVQDQKMELYIKGKKSWITFLSESQDEDQQRRQKKEYKVKIDFQNGQSYEGDVKKSQEVFKITGKGKMTFSDGSFYQGEFVDGKMHGYGQYFWKNTGHWYKGDYKFNFRDGNGRYYYNASRFKQGQWIGGTFQKQDYPVDRN